MSTIVFRACRSSSAHAVSAVARMCGLVTASLFRLIHANNRFSTVCRLARVIEPIARRTPQCRFRRDLGRETPHESVVYLILYALGLAGVAVPVPLDLPDVSTLDAALAAGGVLLVAPHTGLIGQAVIWLGAHGYRPIIVTANTRPPRPGTGKILLGPNFMLRVRTALREGRLVIAMIDAADPAGRRARKVEHADGALWISDGLVRLAVKCGTPTLFGAAKLAGRGICISFARAPAAGATADEVVTAFADFVFQARATLATGLRTRGSFPPNAGRYGVG